MVLPNPDAASLSTADRLHFLGLYAGIAADPPSSVDIIYVFLGKAVPFTSRGGGSVYYEAFYKATSGTVYSRLWNLTTAMVVPGTTDSLTTNTLTVQRSGLLALTDGNSYRAQFGKAGSDTGEAVGADIVVVP